MATDETGGGQIEGRVVTGVPVISVMLAVPDAIAAVAWYRKALGARELWNLGSVVGMEIEGAPFFLAEPERDDWSTPELSARAAFGAKRGRTKPLNVDHERRIRMKCAKRSSLLGVLLLSAGIACGDGSEREVAEEPAAAGDAEAEAPAPVPSADPECPAAEDVAAAVGQPVESRPYGGGCYYETADFEASVTIMRIAPSQADQVEREMRESAAPYDAEVTAIDIGDRGQAWGSPGYGQGYAVIGERAWIADVSMVSGGEDERDAVVEILGMMID